MRNKLRVLFAVGAVLSCTSPTVADVATKLVGLAENELIACAGIPAGQMASGGKTFFQYGDFVQKNVLNQKGCQAIITLQNGVVTKVLLRTKGIVSGPIACYRLFSEC